MDSFKNSLWYSTAIRGLQQINNFNTKFEAFKIAELKCSRKTAEKKFIHEERAKRSNYRAVFMFEIFRGLRRRAPNYDHTLFRASQIYYLGILANAECNNLLSTIIYLLVL